MEGGGRWEEDGGQRVVSGVSGGCKVVGGGGPAVPWTLQALISVLCDATVTIMAAV